MNCSVILTCAEQRKFVFQKIKIEDANQKEDANQELQANTAKINSEKEIKHKNAKNQTTQQLTEHNF